MTAGFISRSHRAIAPFELHRATNLAEAVELVGAGARPHGGGIDLVERMQGGERIASVVDLNGLTELSSIEVVDDVIRIGAAVTHSRIETDPVIAEHRPDLAVAWRTVGNVRIRRTGTIGGNLMAFDKDYDAAPILAATGASLVFASSGGDVRTDVAGRHSDLLLTHVEVPVDGQVRFERSLKPVVTVAVDRHIAIGCAYPQVTVVESLGELDSLTDPVEDAEASAGYRRRMIATIVERLVGEDTP